MKQDARVNDFWGFWNTLFEVGTEEWIGRPALAGRRRTKNGETGGTSLRIGYFVHFPPGQRLFSLQTIS